MANQLILGRALDANGYIAPGAKATIYADGTSTLITVYSDVDGTTAATNPIVADGDGFWPQRYVTEAAKAVVTTSADVALYTLDPCPLSQGTGAAASAVSFVPTIDLPQTNVQDAIEAAAALAVSGFATFGLGITGNATLLANLDATGTGAGIYRFDGATTGTFPTGVAAGDTGMIELWRQAGATAMMELHHATTNRVFRRRMTTSTWGAWREEINVDQATAQGDTIYRGASDFARLAAGAGGKGLVMNAGATAPTWGAAPRVLLASKTASASASLNFTEFNNAVYRYYEFEFENVKPATDNDQFIARVSSDGGATWNSGASDYSNSGVGSQGTGSPVSIPGVNTAASMFFTNGTDVGNAAGEFGFTGKGQLYFAGDAATQTRMLVSGTYENGSSATIAVFSASRRRTAQDTDGIQFLYNLGNIASGTIRMYGVAE